jgi:hypothetical protein
MKQRQTVHEQRMQQLQSEIARLDELNSKIEAMVASPKE